MSGGISVLFSAAPPYYRFAVQELRRRFDVLAHRRVGEDAGVVDLSGTELSAVARACTGGEVRFVRHLAQVFTEFEGRRMSDAARLLTSALEATADISGSIAVHVWATPGVSGGHEGLFHALRDAMTERGQQVARAGCADVLAMCLGEDRTVVGLSPAGATLSDWPGGRIRLASRPQQISRAEFKLEELLSLTPLPLSGPALDLGAAPGGWTRILLQHGCEHVDAVDPGELDERVGSLPSVRWHRTTSGEFLRHAPTDYQVIVNDMRMEPELSASTMVDAAGHMPPGGWAIMTAKLRPHRAVERVDQALARLSEAHDVVFARQLQHNRNEVTIVGRRQG